MNLATYLHTIRYLRPVQIYGRVWFRLYRPHPNLKASPVLRSRSGSWTQPAPKRPGMISPTEFRFLNQTHTLDFPEDWNAPWIEKLWLYNLHYFNDLVTADATRKEQWLRSLIQRWVDDNPPPAGNGWEPYTLSLRIVNWIKWALAGNVLDRSWQESLAVQAHYLEKRLEWHLLGNHLFANAKALVFAGVFFAGEEADRWLNRGTNILNREIPEQILGDGGHFERSPMYHSIILEDLLDLYNILSTYDILRSEYGKFVANIEDRITQMQRWLANMVHPDGEIALFNDAAFGISPAPGELEAYASRMGLKSTTGSQGGVAQLADSGYVRFEGENVVLIADVGEVGPDYLPGHAHADTLGFEMSVWGQRVIVDSGTSCYGTGEERQRQRSTPAHNTVTIDGQDSSEVWGGFRVARRARPQNLCLEQKDSRVRLLCAHDGYRRLEGRPVHSREWRLEGQKLIVSDSIDGSFREAIARYHLHPGVAVVIESGGNGGHLQLPGGKRMGWGVSGGTVRIVPSTYHDEFGVSRQNQCLEVLFQGTQVELFFAW